MRYDECMKKYWTIFLFLIIFFLISRQYAFAHEAYVLTQQEFTHGLHVSTQNPFAGLFDPQSAQVSLFITFFIILLYAISLFLATTSLAAVFDRFVKRAQIIGPLVIRFAISSSFFYAALSSSILGPELSLSSIPGGQLIRFLLFLLSLMIFFGFLTEVAAALGLLLFTYVSTFYGWYMVTYANYFGELLVLVLFGSRFFSFDLFFFGKKTLLKFLQKYRTWEVPIVRMLYGVALIYAGWTIKFAHQSLSIAVYYQYHLQNFFHAKATFIAAGAGLSEILIGMFILFGFAQRLTVVISLIFITLSLFYFREMLWPHFMLYGISFSLFINASDFLTLDHVLIPFLRRLLRKK